LQTFTYDIKPIKDNSRPSEQKLVLLGSTASSEGPVGGTTTSTAESSDNIHSYEVRLGLQGCTAYCTPGFAAYLTVWAPYTATG
jgi:hypothetical protein